MTISKYKTRQTLIDTGFNQKSGNTLTLCGDNLIASSGTLKYTTDQHSTYTARSVVDAGFVTGLTSFINTIGSDDQVIYRGANGITGATDFTYDTVSGVTVPILSISTTPSTELSPEWLLAWDSGTSQVKKVVYSSSVGLTSAINGLGTISDCACLGGLLTNDTTICGSDIYSLNLRGLCNACIITTANNIVLDSRNNSGGVYLKSQCGAIASPVSNFTCAVGIAIDYGVANGLKIHDNRAGVARTGIEYAGDYSTFYSSRSLVDREYVDAIASGLFPHAAVDVATTSPITLSGTSQTIDSIPVATVISYGNRILVKDQVDAKTNGIYSASTGTWGRTSDFDESSETVHGAYTFVLSGTSNNNTQWVLSTPNPITLGVTNLTFTVFSQVTNIIAGQGMTVTKLFGQNTISLGGTLTTGSTVITDSRAIKKGIEYGGNYNSGFSTCSLVTKGFVTGLTSVSDAKLAQLAGFTGTTDARLDYLGVWSGFTNTRLAALGVFTGATNAKFTQLAGFTGTTDARLDYLGVWSGLTNTRLAALGVFTGATNAKLTQLAGFTGTTDARLDYLGVFTGATNAKFTQLAGFTGTTDARLDYLGVWSGATQPVVARALTGATNGLTASSRKVCLGGALTVNTSVTGDFNLCLGTNASRLNTFQVFTQEDAIINSSCSIAMTASGASFCDIAGLPKGIQYVSDYSSTYVPRSLVDKGYVDSVATGLNIHTAVYAATTSGITLSGSPKTIDGVSVAAGQRVLVKNQGIGFTGHTTNGIYIVTGVTWFRAPDYDGSPASEVTNGDLIPVTTGLTQNNSLWALTSQNPIIVGTTPLIFSQFGTTIDVIGGQGICITQVGGVHTVCVNATSGCGLSVGVGGLCLSNSIDGSGLTYTGGVLNVNAALGGAASSISVKVNPGNCLVVNCTDITTAVGAITTANNGLNKAGSNVRLGGPLTGTTTINGGSTLNINQAILNLSGNTSVKITGATVCIGGSTAVKLTSTPSTGSVSDPFLVRATDGTIKTVGSVANNIYSHSAVTTSVALNTGSTYVILANSPSASITITLPATPRDGQVFKIKDVGGAALTNNIIINGNGNNIDGAACGLINTSYGALELMYETTLDAWFSLAFIN